MTAGRAAPPSRSGPRARLRDPGWGQALDPQLRRELMRRLLFVTVVAALGVAGVAYAATSNLYVVNATVSPVRSGTAKAPAPISRTLRFSVSSSQTGQRPAVVSGYKISIFGITENTTA